MMAIARFPFGESAYLAAGVVNAAFMALSFTGAWEQWRAVRRRRAAPRPGESATDLLSLQQNAASFIGASSFFVYGYALPVLDHFLVWPRLAAALLYLMICLEIRHDRPGRSINALAMAMSALLLLEIGGLLARKLVIGQLDRLAVPLMLGVALMLAAGYGHQIALIWRSGRTGAVSLRTMQFILAMDVSTLALALCIGLRTAWAMAVVAIVSALTKIVLLALFRWVRLSPRAAKRRNASAALQPA